MAVLVVAEHDNASIKDATNKVVTAAMAMGGDVDVLVAGSNAKGAADAAAKIDGVRKVLLADGASLDKQMAEPLEALIVPLMSGYDAVLFPASTTGKNAAPRVAAKLDVMQISGVFGVEGADRPEGGREPGIIELRVCPWVPVALRAPRMTEKHIERRACAQRKKWESRTRFG